MILDPNDVKLEIWPPMRPVGGQHVGTGPVGIKGTHVPTGTVAISLMHRSQHRNKKAVMEMLEWGINV